MTYCNINEGKRLVDLNHPNTIPTNIIEQDLKSRFPGLHFPYIKQDHVAGVNSNVHAYCDTHKMFTRMRVGSARGHRQGVTKYGCVACANEHKGRGHKESGFDRRYSDGYVGRSGVQSGIFIALKEAYPDTIWEHTMDNGKEIDVYIPSLKFGVEYNGNYYHSDAVGKTQTYHKDKSFAAYREDKLILHVFTDEIADDFSRYAGYVRTLGDVLRATDAVLGMRNRSIATPEGTKARQVPAVEAKSFIKANSLTWMSEDVLSSTTLFVGVYERGELRSILYGVPGRVLGVATAKWSSDIRVGLKKYASFHTKLEYWAPVRCPLQTALLKLFGYHLLLDMVPPDSRDPDHADRYGYIPPTKYGLTKSGLITIDPDGQPHTIHDCGWSRLKLK